MEAKQTPDQRECALVKDGDWYRYFWQVVNPALGVFPDEWKKLNNVFDGMYEKGAFFERHLSKEAGPFLGIGVGYGGLELVLASRGWRGIGIDNNRDVLFLASQNAAILAQNRLIVCYADIYDPTHFPVFFEGKGIAACVSFGVMEHFKPEEITGMIQQQFDIAPLVVCMVPIGTPSTLKFFGTEQVGPHVEEKTGIYRVLQTPEWWANTVFKSNKIVASHHSRNNYTGVDMTTFVVKK